MHAVILTIFSISLISIFYIYIGYPLIIAGLGLIMSKPVEKNPDFLPSVTILIAAYNEEAGIENTIKNKLELDYPKKKLEIMVVSDASTDRTDEIIKSFEHEGVSFLRQEPRAGKTQALNRALPLARGEIIIFSDANSIYAPNALKMLVRNFGDPSVGYVSGKMVYTNSTGSIIGEGCSAYMKYENLLRGLESKIGSIIGVDGGIDAVRRELYVPMNKDQLPDFILPLRVVDQGFRVIYEPDALLREPALNETKDEHKMRVRVTLRALWAIYDMRKLLSIRKYGFFAFQLWTHKVLRYMCFFFLIGAYITNFFLWNAHLFFQIFFSLQTVAYVGAIICPYLEKKGVRIGPFYLTRYFFIVNLSAAYGFLKFLRGQKQAIWTPRKG